MDASTVVRLELLTIPPNTGSDKAYIEKNKENNQSAIYIQLENSSAREIADVNRDFYHLPFTSIVELFFFSHKKNITKEDLGYNQMDQTIHPSGMRKDN